MENAKHLMVDNGGGECKAPNGSHGGGVFGNNPPVSKLTAPFAQGGLFVGIILHKFFLLVSFAFLRGFRYIGDKFYAKVFTKRKRRGIIIKRQFSKIQGRRI